MPVPEAVTQSITLAEPEINEESEAEWPSDAWDDDQEEAEPEFNDWVLGYAEEEEAIAAHVAWGAALLIAVGSLIGPPS